MKDTTEPIMKNIMVKREEEWVYKFALVPNPKPNEPYKNVYLDNVGRENSFTQNLYVSSSALIPFPKGGVEEVLIKSGWGSMSPVMVFDGHCYFHIEFLIQEYPDQAKDLIKIRDNIKMRIVKNNIPPETVQKHVLINPNEIVNPDWSDQQQH